MLKYTNKNYRYPVYIPTLAFFNYRARIVIDIDSHIIMVRQRLLIQGVLSFEPLILDSAWEKFL